MRTHRQFQGILFTVLGALLGAQVALAVEHSMTGGDALNTTSFNTGAKWDDGQAPKAGDTYVANYTLRSPMTGSHTFAGDLLTITGQLLWKGTDNSSLTISNLVLRGLINNGVGESLAKIYGKITIPDGAVGTIGTGTETDRRQMYIYAPLSGGGALNLFIPRLSADMKEVQLAAANTNFTGPILLVGKGKLTISSEDNLGGNPPVWNPRQLMLNGSVLRFQSSLTLDDPNRGLWLSNQTVTAGNVYPGGRFEVASGVTATFACPVGGEGPFEKTDYGTLILAATNTYTGATTVSYGSLLVNSAVNATASLAVSAGASLGGTGAVQCAVTAAPGSALALAGNGYGTLTLASPAGLSLDGVTLAFDLRAAAGGPSDALALAGPLTLSGTNAVSLSLPAAGLPAGSYTLITYPSRGGDGALSLVPKLPNATLTVVDTAVTLEVTGSGTASAMVWAGDAGANVWEFAAGHWLPLDAPYADGMDVRFDDAGVASVPVLLGASVAPRDIAVATTNNAYTLDAGANALTARNVAKTGTGALTLKGGQRVASLTVGSANGTTYTGGGACTLDAALTLDGALTAYPSAGTFIQTATSALSGTGSVTLGCAANLYGTNTFTGTLTIGFANNTKNVTLYSPLALGSTAGGTSIRGGTSTSTGYNKLVLANGVTVTDETLSITGGSDLRSGLWSASAGACGWDGDIRINSDGQLQIGSVSGNTLTLGSLGRTTITNMGPSMLSFRDAGTVILNSRLAMATNDIGRNDTGTLLINSVSNRVQGVSLSQGVLRLGVDEPFAVAPTLSIGKANSTANKGTLDLNGHALTVSRLIDTHDDANNGTANEGYQRILCALPSALTVSGSTASSYTKVGSILSGPLTLIKAGAGTLTLGQTNALSGAVVVSNGVLAVTASGGFGPGATNIVVAGGTLALSNSVAVTAAANVSFPSGGAGVLSLPAGVNVRVYTLWYGDKQKYAGSYGATGSGARYIDNTRFSGTGQLTVSHGNGGAVLLLQ
jgi:autotransporter-associated beta strand protein